MYYLHSRQMAGQSGAWSSEDQEDRLDRLHMGEGFLGLSARLNLDGSYALVAHDGALEPGAIPLIEPGQYTLSDEGLRQAHEILDPRARAYGGAEDGHQRARVLALSYEDVQGMVQSFDTVGDATSSVLYPDHLNDFCSAVPSDLTEREVIEWVYRNLPSYADYANRDDVAHFMLKYYPEIEAARGMEAASN